MTSVRGSALESAAFGLDLSGVDDVKKHTRSPIISSSDAALALLLDDQDTTLASLAAALVELSGRSEAIGAMAGKRRESIAAAVSRLLGPVPELEGAHG